MSSDLRGSQRWNGVRMSVTVDDIGEVDGQPVRSITLDDGTLRAVLIDLGARLVELHVPDRTGETADVVLAHESPAAAVPATGYFGATCGRFSNRIRRGRFTLDGERHEVTVNEGLNHLHGGVVGFDAQVWSVDVDDASTAVRFGLRSPDGDQGYPGALDITSTYRLADGVLSIRMEAETDAPTVVNMVNHAYWNLGGHTSGDVLGHEMLIESDFFTTVDDELVPDGEVRNVGGTPYDFRTPTPLGARIREVDHGGAGRDAPAGFAGYDHNWVVRGQIGQLRPCVTVVEPRSGRRLDLRTTQAGVQLYTGGYLDGVAGKYAAVYEPFAGFTLETQHFPDSPNIGHFPSSVLRPGERYDHQMELAFSTVE